MAINFGKYKAYYMRLTPYTQIATMAMVFYVFIQDNNWLPWYGWILLFLIVFSGIHVFDKHRVWHDEATEQAKRNGVLMENNRLLKEINQKL